KGLLKKVGKLPRHIYLRDGNYSPLTLAKRFGGWTSVPTVFQKFAKRKPGWADVLALIPAAAARDENSSITAFSPMKPVNERSQKNIATDSPTGLKRQNHRLLKGRVIYGNPTNLPGVPYEPVNEQGVVLLFGRLANELGYRIEAVQVGFP